FFFVLYSYTLFFFSFFFFNDPATTEIYTLSLHDALPIFAYYVHPVNIQTACLIMEGAEFTENIINGVERPVKAAELFAFHDETEIGRAVQQECRDRSRMPSSA